MWTKVDVMGMQSYYLPVYETDLIPCNHEQATIAKFLYRWAKP